MLTAQVAQLQAAPSSLASVLARHGGAPAEGSGGTAATAHLELLVDQLTEENRVRE